MTVAVAHSDTEPGKLALRRAAAEALLYGEPLAVLDIVPGTADPHTAGPALEATVGQELVDFAGLEITVHTATEGHDTAGALVDLATEIGATLLVMGTRRRSPVGKLLLGSTVQRVLLDAPMPVLVVKAAAT